MSAAKKRAGFAGDHPALGVVVVIALLCAVVSSFALSAFGLWEQAGAMGVEGGYRILLVLTIDMLIVGSTVAILIRRGRGEATWFLWAVVLTFTAISVWANFSAHWEQGQGLTPSIIGGLMPLTLLAATEVTLLTLVRGEGEAPAPRASKRAPKVPAATAPVVVADSVVSTPAPVAKPASRPRPAARAARVPIDEASPEVAALLTEFDALAGNPASSSSQGSPESTRLSEVVRELADDHGIGFSALAARTEHLSSDSLRQRANKMRKRLVDLVDA